MPGTPTAAAPSDPFTRAHAAALAAPAPADTLATPVVGGDLPAALLREWGPVLKPMGLGLLVALHSFEETTPGHPYYGWTHCTQNALAAYLDTSQDSIARYTALLQVCGLVQIEDVETPRGKQKLYRVARGLPLPSLALLEYLLFDADSWTRKHVAWLAMRFAPLGPETELTRLAAVLARAYRVGADARGLPAIVEGARLTAPKSYRRRKAPAATQPGLPAPQTLSAPCGVPDPRGDQSASSGLPAPDPSQVSRQAASGGAPEAADGGAVEESASCGVPDAASQAGESAASGQEPAAPQRDDKESAWSGPGVAWTGGTRPSIKEGDSAWSGPGPTGQHAAADTPGRESAASGVGAGPESASGGLAPAPYVNVESLNALNEKNDNDNDAPGGGLARAPEGEEALVRWGTAALGDQDSLDWHRRCLAEHGPERYCWAIEATYRARERGKVGNPGAYFTSLLRRRSGPPAQPTAGAMALPLRPAVSADAASPGAASPAAAPPPDPECARLWQSALILLRATLPTDDYPRILRYAVLLELDRAAGWALLGLPAEYMLAEVDARLAGPIGAALGQVVGGAVRVAAVVLPGQGRLAGAMPTLGGWLAGHSSQHLT